jgi:glutathione S-transferase
LARAPKPRHAAEKREANMDGQLILHEDVRSGNCYKIRLVAAHLDIPLMRKFYDITKGETRTPEFLANVSANGRIPVLQIGDRFLSESNAVCFWLADGSHLIPSDRFDRADMLRWMFWEQYHHEPTVATLRFWLSYLGEHNLNDEQSAQLGPKRKAAEAALKMMDEHLMRYDWFVGAAFSLADICLYAYTHVAEEGRFDLSAYPQVLHWLDRVASMPGHIVMKS